MYISTGVPSSQPHVQLVLTSGRRPLGSRGGVFPHSQPTLAEGASTPMIQLTPPHLPSSCPRAWSGRCSYGCPTRYISEGQGQGSESKVGS